MASWRGFIEWALPWYDARREQMRNVRTDRVIRHSEAARLRSERVIAEYRAAEKAAGKAGERVIEEVRRADDR